MGDIICQTRCVATGVDSCRIEYITNYRFHSAVVCFLLRLSVGLAHQQRIMDILVDNLLIEMWHCFDSGLDLCRAKHRKHEIML